jgi:hypothetical protein
MNLRRFALLIAGPRDFAVNFALNGFIAWLVFRNWTSVPLSGSPSIFVFVLPMTVIESAATTFFGCLAGALARKTGRVVPTLAPDVPWVRQAVRSAVLAASIAFAAACGVKWMLWRFYPEVALTPRQAIVVVALLSGALAYLLCSRAALRAGRL